MSRKTRYLVKCKGTVIAECQSYNTMELEPVQLLLTASKAAGKLGWECYDKMVSQRAIACENLTVEAISSYEYIGEDGEIDEQKKRDLDLGWCGQTDGG